MSRTIALLVARVLGGVRNGLKLPTPPGVGDSACRPRKFPRIVPSTCNNARTNVTRLGIAGGVLPLLSRSAVRSARLNRLKRRECLMSRSIALLVAPVVGGGCNGLEPLTSPRVGEPACRPRKFPRVLPHRPRCMAVGLLLAIILCSGCERESRNTPSPTAPSPTAPSGPSLAAVQIEGRVIDADFEKPIPGAHITTLDVCYPEVGCRRVDPPYSAVANEQGIFRLTANLPQDWNELSLKVENPGFDPARMSLRPESATNVVLRAYPAITIRAGESVQLRVLFQETCTFADDEIACRRIGVEAAAGELINLEVLPQTQDVVGVMAEPFPLSLLPLQTRLTVSGGAAWIVRSRFDGMGVASSGTGIVTVVARR